MSKSEAGIFSQMFQSAVRLGFRGVYPHVKVNPEKYLLDVRRIYGLPIDNWKDARRLDEKAIAPVSERIIHSASRMAALEGMGFGIGGLATALPDMGVLAAITLRMLQKLSLVHGFEYSTRDEMAALWMAAATAAGVDLARDFLEKQAVERVAPRVIDAMAVKVGSEVAEKWAGRAIPLISAGVAATINYYFVRTWGRRGREHFLEKHRSGRGIIVAPRLLPAHAAPEFN